MNNCVRGRHCETSVLLHWNADKQREETWLYIGFQRGSWVTSDRVVGVAKEVLGRQPQVIVSANTYLHGAYPSRSRFIIDWLAGPITEEEAKRL